jgi:transketolase
VLSENIPTPMGRIGVKDLFGQVGSQDFLQETYELTAADIVKKVEVVLKMKK